MSFLINSYAFGTAAAYDTDYQAVLDHATTNGYTLPDATRKTAENTLYTSLKAESGLWTLIDAFANFYTNGDANFALINGKTRADNYTAVNTPTFASLTGYTGNGADKYIRGWKNVGTAGSKNFTQNSAHIIVAWTSGGLTTASYGRNQALNHTFSAASTSVISQNTGGNGIALNDAVTFSAYTMGTSGEVAIITRTASGSFKLFNNTYTTGTTITKTSGALTTNQYINALGAGSNGSASTVRFLGMGGGLTDSQAIAYMNAVKTLTGF